MERLRLGRIAAKRTSPIFDAMSTRAFASHLKTSHRIPLLILAFAAVAPLSGLGAKLPKVERREMKREEADATPSRNAAEDAQSRAAAKLREQLEVADDAEWDVIAGRIANVIQLRGALAGAGSIRSTTAVDKIKPSAKGDRSAQLEQDALRSALRDKMPDAEIRARLARAHDVRRQNEAKLTKAQEDLRAILTVRQEAVAVVAGLLPP